MGTDTLARQLDELQLLSCSLLPGERLTILEDAELWHQALAPEADAAAAVAALQQHLTPPAAVSSRQHSVRFEVGLADTRSVYFEVALPRAYPAAAPAIAVRGDALGRADQQHWQAALAAAQAELAAAGSEYPVFQLLSEHLLPRLHAARPAPPAAPPPAPAPAAPPARYHALLTSHHLVSPAKRRSMHAWAGALALAGFAKVGHPGVIYCEGARADVEAFVARVRAMQWLALRVRFVKPLPLARADAAPRWRELERVGDVVAEMRRRGREKYVVEMGIGSAGNINASSK